MMTRIIVRIMTVQSWHLSARPNNTETDRRAAALSEPRDDTRDDLKIMTSMLGQT